MKRATVDKGWIKCTGCGHKLFKINEKLTAQDLQDMGIDTLGIEIKCHSCKEIITVGGVEDAGART